MIQLNKRKQTFCGKSEDAKFKIILVGDSAVGKTTLFLAFTDEDCQEKTNPSVTAVDFRLQPLQIDGQTIKLHIWDTAGQQRYRSLVQSFFKGCQGAVIVFDLSRRQSFENATNEWFKMCSARINPSQIILVGNKADLEHKVSEDEIRQWSTQNGVSYFLISVKNLEKVDEPFMALSRKMIERKKMQVKAELCRTSKQNKTINAACDNKECKVKLQAPTKAKTKSGCC